MGKTLAAAPQSLPGEAELLECFSPSLKTPPPFALAPLPGPLQQLTKRSRSMASWLMLRYSCCLGLAAADSLLSWIIGVALKSHTILHTAVATAHAVPLALPWSDEIAMGQLKAWGLSVLRWSHFSARDKAMLKQNQLD